MKMKFPSKKQSKPKPRRLFQKKEDESMETPEHEMSEPMDFETMEDESEMSLPPQRRPLPKKAFKPRRLFQK